MARVAGKEVKCRRSGQTATHRHIQLILRGTRDTRQFFFLLLRLQQQKKTRKRAKKSQHFWHSMGVRRTMDRCICACLYIAVLLFRLRRTNFICGTSFGVSRAFSHFFTAYRRQQCVSCVYPPIAVFCVFLLSFTSIDAYFPKYFPWVYRRWVSFLAGCCCCRRGCCFIAYTLRAWKLNNLQYLFIYFAFMSCVVFFWSMLFLYLS